MNNDRVRIHTVQILAEDWSTLRKTTFDYQRRDGHWQTMSRETYDRGNGAVILLYNCAKQTVVLIRQFRFPAFGNGSSGFLIEACAGLLDGQEPEACARRESEEETGFRVNKVQKVFEAFMSPGSVTERLFFFLGEYDDSHRVTSGGGLSGEGEDIEVLEISFAEALAKVSNGEIVDGKTIMLLQHLQISGLMAAP